MVGLAGLEPAASASRTPRASICATTRLRCPWAQRSSGGRSRSPISWFRARCAADCATPECAALMCFHRSVPRVLRRAVWICQYAPGDSNSDPRGKNPFGFPLPQRRMSAGGESRTLNGPSPPGSEPGASSCSATPARRTEAFDLGTVDPDGLEPSPHSVQGSCTASRALGPLSAGQDSNLPCPRAPGLRPGAVP